MNPNNIVQSKFSIFRRKITMDRSHSWCMILPSPVIRKKGVYDPDTFKYHPDATVRKIFLFQVRLPEYKFISVSLRSTDIMIKRDKA